MHVPGLLAKVPEPAWFKPTDEQFFMTDPTTGRPLPNPTFLRDHFLREGRLTEAQAVFLVDEATRLLTQEPNMLELQGPISGMHRVTRIGHATKRDSWMLALPPKYERDWECSKKFRWIHARCCLLIQKVLASSATSGEAVRAPGTLQ